MPRPPDIKEIKAALAADARNIADMLFGKPTSVTRSEARYDGGKIRVFISGAKRGGFTHFAEDVGGDLIDAIGFVYGLDAKGARKRALEIIGGASAVADAPRVSPARKAREDRAIQQQEARRTAAALEAWGEACPIEDTLGEVYFRSRGIRAPLPATLRFHRALRHFPTNSSMPAVICAVANADTKCGAIWSIYIQPDGLDRLRDDRPRSGLGRLAGGAVRLSAPAERLYITEGIETGMAVLDVLPGAAVWAARAVGFFEPMWVPDIVKEVIFLPDGDRAGYEAICGYPAGPFTDPKTGETRNRQAKDGALKVWRRDRGLRCGAVTSLPNDWDWNDVLMRPTANAIRPYLFNLLTQVEVT